MTIFLFVYYYFFLFHSKLELIAKWAIKCTKWTISIKTSEKKNVKRRRRRRTFLIYFFFFLNCSSGYLLCIVIPSFILYFMITWIMHRYDILLCYFVSRRSTAECARRKKRKNVGNNFFWRTDKKYYDILLHSNSLLFLCLLFSFSLHYNVDQFQLLYYIWRHFSIKFNFFLISFIWLNIGFVVRF